MTGMSLAGCSDFLNDNRYPLSSQAVNAEFWNNPQNVQNQINYFYEDYSGYGNGSGGGTFYWSWLSDDQCGRTAFNDWTYKTVQPAMSAWNAPYIEIRRANLIIQGLENSTMDEASRINFLALARLHRGRSYYDLVRRFGDVPLVTKPLSPDSEAELYGPRTPRNEVMDFVLDDLDYACANIADVSGKTILSRDMAHAFKLEVCLYEGSYAKYHLKDAVRATKFFNEAIKAGEAIAEKYPINPEYLSLYQSARTEGLGYKGLEANPEIIMFKPYQEGVFMNSISDYSNASDGVAGITRDAFEAFVFKDGLPASKTSYDTTDKGVAVGDNALSIQKLLDVRDGRLGFITYPNVFFQGLSWAASNTTGMWSSTGYGVRKFNNPEVPATVVNEIGKNYLCAPLFWGARLYVGILEAKAENGSLSDTDIATYMKPLWDRAGIDTSKLSKAFLEGINDTANNMGVSSLIWEIRRLRRCELMLDDGIRYWDLVRWHQLDLLDTGKHPNVILGANIANSPVPCTVATGDYVNGSFGQTRTFDNKYYLYPIPTGQIELNGSLTQNPGW